jgi:hypothetical protein
MQFFTVLTHLRHDLFVWNFLLVFVTDDPGPIDFEVIPL